MTISLIVVISVWFYHLQNHNINNVCVCMCVIRRRSAEINLENSETLSNQLKKKYGFVPPLMDESKNFHQYNVALVYFLGSKNFYPALSHYKAHLVSGQNLLLTCLKKTNKK